MTWLLVMLTLAFGAVVLPVVALAAMVFWWLSRPRVVDVEKRALLGLDGLCLDGRFTSASALSIQFVDSRCLVRAASGKVLTLLGEPDEMAQARTVAEAIQARSASRLAEPERDLAGEALLTSMRVETLREEGYRAATLDPSRNLSILEDDAAAPRSRIAAAALLEPGLDVDQRVRVAAAAAASAHPQVRKALFAAIGEGDEDTDDDGREVRSA